MAHEHSRKRSWKRLIQRGLTLAIVAMASVPAAMSAEPDTVSYRIYFPQGSAVYHQKLLNNEATVDSVEALSRSIGGDPSRKVKELLILGSCSPEGSLNFNTQLAMRRVATLQAMLPDFGISSRVLENKSVNWVEVRELVEADLLTPYRDEALALLEDILSEKSYSSERERINKFRALRSGVVYRYVYDKMFPMLRYAELRVLYNTIMPEQATVDTVEYHEPEAVFVDTVVTTAVEPKHRGGLMMDVRTNALYDALLLPNVGVEFYLGSNISVGANWMYGWWSRNTSHRYWRAYGGDVNVRRWFGREAEDKPLTGHHIGVYGQMLTYDVEFGGKGYMGGEPGDNIWHRMSWGAGVEYGYSLPIARRLNIDFTIGVGYFGGRYYEYIPLDGHYVWQATKNRHWFGPTKAEISLVWLIGNGNTNKKK